MAWSTRARALVRITLLAGIATSAISWIGCGLNPQPLPPEDSSETTGSSPDDQNGGMAQPPGFVGGARTRADAAVGPDYDAGRDARTDGSSLDAGPETSSDAAEADCGTTSEPSR